MLLAALAFTAAMLLIDLAGDAAGAVPAVAHDHTAHAHDTVCVRMPAVPGLCTHGPDAPPDGVTTSDPTLRTINRRIALGSYEASSGGDGAYSASALAKPVVCGTSGARVQAVYMHHSGNNRFSKLLPTIRTLAMAADEYVNRSAAQVGSGLRIRWATTSECKVSVKRVVVPTSARTDFNAAITAMRKAGLDANDRKYLMWLDTAGGLCGIGTSIGDDGKSQLNANNQITGFAQVNRQCWGGVVEMHELFHTLGAVQRSAPRSTKYGHCRDENDAMCYVDGPGTTMISPEPCPSAPDWQLDCRKNDYFNPKPPSGSYIAGHWNTAKSRWLEPDDPPPTAPVVTVPAASARLPGVRWQLHGASKSADGSALKWVWRVNGYGVGGVPVSVPCAFSNNKVREPVFWCKTTFWGPVRISATVTDGKGLTNATTRHVDFTIPTTARKTRLKLISAPASVEKASNATAVNVQLRATIVDDATGKVIIGMPMVIGDYFSGDSVNVTSNANGVAVWNRSVQRRVPATAISATIGTLWAGDSDDGLFEWTPVFGTPTVTVNGTGPLLTVTLSPNETQVPYNKVTLYHRPPGGSWAVVPGYADVVQPGGDGPYEAQFVAPLASGDYQFRKGASRVYRFGTAVSPIYPVP